MKTIAIVQARMGSQRLPGKAMKELCGKPILQHVVERLRDAKRLDDVIVAIPKSQKDDVLAEFCSKMKYSFFRGSEQDVLLRYWQAAHAFKADVVVRVTADCPLIDPGLLDTIVKRHVESSGNDYTSNVVIRSFPRGVDTEVVSIACLDRLHQEAKDPFYREHVTNLIHDHMKEYKTGNVLRAKGDRSDLRLCVDTQEDFDVVQAVAQGVQGTSIEEVIAFLDVHPKIAKLNAHVEQKHESRSST